MKDFMLLMYGDATHPESDSAWATYFEKLHNSGRFDGGSSIGGGMTLRKGEEAKSATMQIVGFIRIRAADLAEAQTFVIGNPVYENGGTIEIRELPQD